MVNKFDSINDVFDLDLISPEDLMNMSSEDIDNLSFDLIIDDAVADYATMNALLENHKDMKLISAFVMANEGKIKGTIRNTCFKYGMPYDEDYYADFLYKCQVNYGDFNRNYFAEKGCYKYDANGNVEYPKIEQYVFSRLKYYMKDRRNRYYKERKRFVNIDNLTASKDKDDKKVGTISEDRVVSHNKADTYKTVELKEDIKQIVEGIKVLSEIYKIDIIKYLILLSEERRNTDEDIARQLGVSVSRVRTFQKVFLKGVGPEEEVTTLRTYIYALLTNLAEAQLSLCECYSL